MTTAVLPVLEVCELRWLPALSSHQNDLGCFNQLPPPNVTSVHFKFPRQNWFVASVQNSWGLSSSSGSRQSTQGRNIFRGQFQERDREWSLSSLKIQNETSVLELRREERLRLRHQSPVRAHQHPATCRTKEKHVHSAPMTQLRSVPLRQSSRPDSQRVCVVNLS